MKSIKVIPLLLCLGGLSQLRASSGSFVGRAQVQASLQVEHKRQDEKEIKGGQQREEAVYQATFDIHKFPRAVWDLVERYLIHPSTFSPVPGLQELHNFVRKSYSQFWLLDAATLIDFCIAPRKSLIVYDPVTKHVLF